MSHKYDNKQNFIQRYNKFGVLTKIPIFLYFLQNLKKVRELNEKYQNSEIMVKIIY